MIVHECNQQYLKKQLVIEMDVNDQIKVRGRMKIVNKYKAQFSASFSLSDGAPFSFLLLVPMGSFLICWLHGLQIANDKLI